jgi:hypothetical protein
MLPDFDAPMRSARPAVWGFIAEWTQVRVYELLRTWQIIAVDVAIVSGLVMLALLVYAAWERLSR